MNIVTRGKEARARLAAGAKELADVVGATLGPKGRNVVINRGYGQHAVTKDGVTVAKEVVPEGHVERMGAQLILEASTKTADNVGDGTTTSAVLAGALLSRGLQDIESARFKLDIEAYKRGANEALKTVTEAIKASSVPVETEEQLVQVATISANNDAELGELIGKAMHALGKDGVMTVQESRGTETAVEKTDGFQFDRGYISPYMMTDSEKGHAFHEEVPIFVTDQRISSGQDMGHLMRTAAQAGHTKLVVIADDVSDEALTTAVVNRMRGTFICLAVKAPGFGDRRGDILQDIATVVGAKFWSKPLGRESLQDVTFEDYGAAQSVTATKDTTTVVGGRGDKKDLDERIAAVKRDLERAENEFDKERLRERVGRMVNGIAVLRVGGKTEAEMHEKKYLVEDAVCAVKAAMKSGVVPGGGSAFWHASKKLSIESGRNQSELLGLQILDNALYEPLMRIAENAGKDPVDILDQLLTLSDHPRSGWNAKAEKLEEDMVKAGIIDPTDVAIQALTNAMSAALSILTTEAVIHEADKKENGGAE